MDKTPIPDDWLYEYAVVRFVPRAHREEFLNIGLVMMNKRKKWLKGKIYIDEEKIKALFPLTDLDTLHTQCSLFERKDVPSPELSVEERFRWLTAVKSASLRVSPTHPGIVRKIVIDSKINPQADTDEIMNEEFSLLFNELVI